MIARDQTEDQEPDDDEHGGEQEQPMVVADPRGGDRLFDPAHLAGRWWRLGLIGVMVVDRSDLVRVQPQVLRIGAERSADEGVAGEGVEVFEFERRQLVDPKLGVARGFFQGEPPEPARLPRPTASAATWTGTSGLGRVLAFRSLHPTASASA